MSAPEPSQLQRFCRHCGYSLAHLPEQRCPECGTPFDPGDPKTYRRGSGRSRLRKRLWGWAVWAIVLIVAGIGLWGVATRYARRVTVELEIHNAVLRTVVDHTVAGISIHRGVVATTRSDLSEFLDAFADGGGEQWVECSVTIYDYRGRKRRQWFTRMDEVVSKRLSEGRVTTQCLVVLQRSWPELPDRIRRDLLGAPNSGAARWLAWLLEDACRQPQNGAVERLVGEWDEVCSNPGRYADL